MGKTSIEWTARPGTQGESWNVVTGCTPVGPGCLHCYARRQAERFWPTQYLGAGTYPWKGKEHPWVYPPHERGRTFADVMYHPERLEAPLHWRGPRTVLVTSMGDLWHPDVPDAFIDQVQAVMQLCPEHLFIDVTKRPERRRDYLLTPGLYDRILHQADILRARFPRKRLSGIGVPDPAKHPAPWIWRLTSIEDQATADSRIPPTLETPAAVRGVSAEPLLGPVDLVHLENPDDHCHASALHRQHDDNRYEFDNRLDWVIVGGESGPQARPCRVAWIRTIVKQCQGADVPVFVKQVGAYAVDRNDRLGDEGPGYDPCDPRDWPEPERGWDDGSRGNIERLDDGYQGAPVHIRLKSRKGNDPAEWPADLRVREFPERRR